MNRKDLFVKHFLKPKRLIRKFIPFIGWLEGVLSIISVLIGKDVDVFESIYASIPVIGVLLADGGEGGGSGGGSSGVSGGSSGTEIEFEAYAQLGSSYSDKPYRMVYNRVEGTITPPDQVVIDDGDRRYEMDPNEVKWIGNSEDQPRFSVDWSPAENSYVIDKDGEERLKKSGLLDPGAHVRGFEGFLGTLKHFLLLPLTPFTGLLEDSDAAGIGGAVAKLMIFLLIGGIILFGALSVFGGSAAGDYLSFFGGETADRFAGVGASSQAEQAVGTFQQAKARAFCLMKGPSCLRQWRLNNTQRPGSNEVGQQYGVSIDRFEMGQAEKIDIARKEEDYEIPISFTLSNTRHGLKGIDALDVEYRIRVIDSQRGLNKPYCDSNWTKVDGFDADGDGDSNDIYPGTSASTGFLKLDEFTLEGCEMLQPALGEYRKVRLDVKYDYSSQATLYFRAMSLQNLQSNPNIQKNFKDSETADTPVKAALSVNSPVLYDQETMEPQPFGVRSTLNTDEFDVRYQVRDLKVIKSEMVEIPDSTSEDCQLGPQGDSVLSLQGNAKSAIEGEDGERPWFDRNSEPPIFGCAMQLSSPETINPTGETLTMGVRSNYTVSVDENIDSFEVLNSRCSEFNCPLLVTVDDADANSDEEPGSLENPWQIGCGGVDAGSGCSIIEFGSWGTLSTSDVLNAGFDSEIDRREIAFATSGLPLNANETVDPDTAFGIEEDNWREIDPDEDGQASGTGYAILQHTDYQGTKEVEYVGLDDDAPGCWQKWKEDNSDSYNDLRVVSYNSQNQCSE